MLRIKILGFVATNTNMNHPGVAVQSINQVTPNKSRDALRCVLESSHTCSQRKLQNVLGVKHVKHAGCAC